LLVTLSEFVRSHREQILACWLAEIRRHPLPSDLTHGELWDSLPLILDELAGALTRHETPSEVAPPIGSVWETHGLDRLRSGFDVQHVVREFGILADCIIAAAERDEISAPLSAYRILMNALNAGAAASIVAYIRRRDHEVEQARTKHLAFLAHELRSPLMAARAVVHGLRHPTVENAPTLIGLLDRSLARLQEQIDNVLTTDRLETGLDLVPEQFAVRDLVEAVREEAEVEGRLRRIRISTDVSTNLNLRGERRLLQSALTNVVRNAVKFTSEGGTVQIRAREAPNAVMIEVEDECGGLPAGAASVIFEPFVQRGRDRSGFGLSLAIARQAVEAHGGRLLLQDLPGRGCIFRLELPAASARRA
jgi:hypothetical protein